MPPQRVCPWIVRERFNRGQYAERASAGHLLLSRIRSEPPAPRVNEPPGTRSEIIEYRDPRTRRRIALVHRYLRPDGSIGGSGRVDPKWLRDSDEILIPSHDDSVTCADCR
jgi:hypothetical protein